MDYTELQAQAQYEMAETQTRIDSLTEIHARFKQKLDNALEKRRLLDRVIHAYACLAELD